MEIPVTTVVPKKKKLLNGINITFTYPSGSKYIGSFKDGKLHGYGVYTYVPSGDVYAGEWKADMKHGHGTYTYAKGDKYVGEWYGGKKNGKGRFLFVNGDEYVGCWGQDKMEGFGVFTLRSNDSKYCGYWQDGLRFGKGVLYSGNGDVYDGEWANGKEHGFGIFQQMNGDLYCGEWNEGIMDGKGVIREKGLLFLVEYMGGFIISKIPFDPLVDKVDPGWEKSYARYSEWIQRPRDLDKKGKGNGEDDSELLRQLEESRHENLVLKHRIEDLMRSLRNAVDASLNDEMEKKDLLILAQRNRVYQSELETIIDDLRIRVSLIEATLQEKMLEQMRLKDELKTKNMNLTSALEKLETIGNRYRSKSGSVRHENASFDDDEAELQKLREQNLELLKMNTEYQKKVTFFTSENAKLTKSLHSAEEATDAVTQAYEGAREQFDKFTGLLSQHDALMNGNAAAAENEDMDGMSEEAIKNRLKRINQLNAELSERNSALKKKLTANDNASLDDENRITKSNAALRDKNTALQETVKALRSELEETKQSLQCTKEALDTYRKKNNELAEQVSSIAKTRCADPSLIKSIDEKIERVAKLENENAELARLLEEARAQVEEDHAVVKEEKKKRKSSLVQQHETDMEDAKKELTKLQKKVKKINGERKKTSLELYETQVSLSRVERALQMLEGGVVVAAYVKDDGSTTEDTVVTINPVDTSQLVYNHADTQQSFQFDCCTSGDVTIQTMFNELRRPLVFVSMGQQVSLVTVGESHTKKSTFLKKLFPLFMQYLNSLKDQQTGEVYSIGYRVAVVEIGVHGGYDCISRSSIRRIVKDDHGYVVPEGATFCDCLPNSVVSTVTKQMDNRIQINGQSHMWIQIQRTRTHRVLQTTVTGRLTLLDLCGPSSILNQDDIEASQFANHSAANITDVVCALQARQSVIPFSKSLETNLLFDLFGGNSFTTILGCVNKGKKHTEATEATLNLLDRFAKIRNGPFLQDFISSDILRWKEIVAALSSEEQSRKEWVEIDDLK